MLTFLQLEENLDDATIAKFQNELGAMGYKFLFITLAGFHALNFSMFNLAKDYAGRQMSAYVQLQEAEFAAEKAGYTATKHQREVGTGYFDEVTQAIMGGNSPSPPSPAPPKKSSSRHINSMISCIWRCRRSNVALQHASHGDRS